MYTYSNGYEYNDSVKFMYERYASSATASLSFDRPFSIAFAHP
jgi:hypothetical protein